MDAEANKSIWFGVTLTVVVLLIGAISMTMVLGRNAANRTLDAFTEWVGLSNNELKYMNDTVTRQSAATVQMLICTNRPIMHVNSETHVILRGDTIKTDLLDISTNAHGDVILEVHYYDGAYWVKIHEHDCNIEKINGVCNCASH